jgi:hypothetical protein
MPGGPLLHLFAHAISTWLRCKDQRRSAMIVNASMEHRIIGAINQPPAIMISSTLYHSID